MNSINKFMYALLKANDEGTRIEYYHRGNKTLPIVVEEGHQWDLVNNVYNIINPKQLIVRVDKDRNILGVLDEDPNGWTRSDFGRNADGTSYLLLREVDQKDI